MMLHQLDRRYHPNSQTWYNLPTVGGSRWGFVGLIAGIALVVLIILIIVITRLCRRNARHRRKDRAAQAEHLTTVHPEPTPSARRARPAAVRTYLEEDEEEDAFMASSPRMSSTYAGSPYMGHQRTASDKFATYGMQEMRQDPYQGVHAAAMAQHNAAVAQHAGYRTSTPATGYTQSITSPVGYRTATPATVYSQTMTSPVAATHGGGYDYGYNGQGQFVESEYVNGYPQTSASYPTGQPVAHDPASYDPAYQSYGEPQAAHPQSTAYAPYGHEAVVPAGQSQYAAEPTPPAYIDYQPPQEGRGTPLHGAQHPSQNEKAHNAATDM